MSSEHHRPFLSSLRYFQGFEPREIGVLLGVLQERRLVDGEVLFSEGEPGDACYLVASGEMRVVIGDGPGAKELARLFTDAGMRTDYTDNIKLHEWQKVALNAALAPVTALTGLTMKETMDHPQLREIVATLLQEGIDEAAQLGLEFPEGFFDHGMAYLEKGGYHKPSMLIDVELGLPTEIDALNGKIAEYGRSREAAHCNRTITALVKGLEVRNRNLQDQKENPKL